mmetsp:Transcript_81622/g.210151  ORF Transcript_81622/g.210151 Transcript_81622/m.210151 type:complete len:210 (+) Transcript_81622:1420-2049(+)
MSLSFKCANRLTTWLTRLIISSSFLPFSPFFSCRSQNKARYLAHLVSLLRAFSRPRFRAFWNPESFSKHRDTMSSSSALSSSTRSMYVGGLSIICWSSTILVHLCSMYGSMRLVMCGSMVGSRRKSLYMSVSSSYFLLWYMAWQPDSISTSCLAVFRMSSRCTTVRSSCSDERSRYWPSLFSSSSSRRATSLRNSGQVYSASQPVTFAR